MAQKTQSPEFSNSIFVKFLGHSFLYFKLLIYLPEIKRPKCFRGVTPFLPGTPTNNAPTWTCCRAYTQHLQTPTCILLNLPNVPKWTLGYPTFKATSIKEITMMNLIVAKNEFDPYDAMVGQLAIDSLQISW